MEKYKVITSAQAMYMLGEHIGFLAEVNVDAAFRKKNQILAAIASLSDMPERYPFFNERYLEQDKYHKMFVKDWYLLLYIIEGNTVFIDYILDCREDYPWLLHRQNKI